MGIAQSVNHSNSNEDAKPQHSLGSDILRLSDVGIDSNIQDTAIVTANQGKPIHLPHTQQFSKLLYGLDQELRLYDTYWEKPYIVTGTLPQFKLFQVPMQFIVTAIFQTTLDLKPRKWEKKKAVAAPMETLNLLKLISVDSFFASGDVPAALLKELDIYFRNEFQFSNGTEIKGIKFQFISKYKPGEPIQCIGLDIITQIVSKQQLSWLPTVNTIVNFQQLLCTIPCKSTTPIVWGDGHVTLSTESYPSRIEYPVVVAIDPINDEMTITPAEEWQSIKMPMWAHPLLIPKCYSPNMSKFFELLKHNGHSCKPETVWATHICINKRGITSISLQFGDGTEIIADCTRLAKLGVKLERDVITQIKATVKGTSLMLTSNSHDLTLFQSQGYCDLAATMQLFSKQLMIPSLFSTRNRVSNTVSLEFLDNGRKVCRQSKALFTVQDPILLSFDLLKPYVRAHTLSVTLTPNEIVIGNVELEVEYSSIAQVVPLKQIMHNESLLIAVVEKLNFPSLQHFLDQHYLEFVNWTNSENTNARELSFLLDQFLRYRVNISEIYFNLYSQRLQYRGKLLEEAMEIPLYLELCYCLPTASLKLGDDAIPVNFTRRVHNTLFRKYYSFPKHQFVDTTLVCLSKK